MSAAPSLIHNDSLTTDEWKAPWLVGVYCACSSSAKPREWQNSQLVMTFPYLWAFSQNTMYRLHLHPAEHLWRGCINVLFLLSAYTHGHWVFHIQTILMQKKNMRKRPRKENKMCAQKEMVRYRNDTMWLQRGVRVKWWQGFNNEQNRRTDKRVQEMQKRKLKKHASLIPTSCIMKQEVATECLPSHTLLMITVSCWINVCVGVCICVF